MISLIRQIINPSNQLKNIVNSVKPVIKPIAPQQNSQTDVEETSETKKASYRMAKLIMVTPNNNNKFYEMREKGDGMFTATYGRVGTKGAQLEYPMSQWDQKVREKTRKGYKDQTALFAELKVEEEMEVLDAKDENVKRLVNELMSFARKSISHHYMVSAEQVSEKQVAEAQKTLDALVKKVKRSMDVELFNAQLIELYQVIPRKMKQVKNHLIEKPKGNKGLWAIKDMLASEQATLDVMRGQVELNNAKKEATPEQKQVTLLESLGLHIEVEKDAKAIRLIKRMMKNNATHFSRAYRVTNYRTQTAYDQFLAERKNKKSELFWHGSRNENWFSIIKEGLVLRPANAIINGKMFGYGLYFADKCQKSLNYTSFRGSYWARGNSNKAFLALYDVHVGNQLKVKKHESWCCSLSKTNLKKRGEKYDSIYAQGGVDLINNEYIVYDSAQSTIRYLVEIKN